MKPRLYLALFIIPLLRVLLAGLIGPFGREALAWAGPNVPLGRSLAAATAEGRGLSVDRCAGARVEVRFRHGGERFQPAGRRHSTALKKLLQASAVPPWLRDRIPLIYIDGELAAVAGLWVGESYAVRYPDRGWVVTWTELPGTAA